MSEGAAGQHWPGLDGLRGVAAIAVVVFHANLGPAVNGFVGVDVFFALSGFLITSILLGEIERHGRVRLRRFYVRRILRLYPALLATGLFVLAAGTATGQLRQVAPGVAAAWAYAANWWMYTGRQAPLLEHTWTLAIEEHFYFIWPLLLFGLTRPGWPRWLSAAMALALVAVIFTPWREPITAVRGTYLRGFPIVWGSLLAVAVRHWRWWPRVGLVGSVGTLATAALLVVLVMPVRLADRWLTGPNSLIGVLSVCVLAGVVMAPGSWGDRLLSVHFLQWFGARSYGLYLYHFPVMSVLRHHVDVGPVWIRVLLGMAASVVLAWASFRWLEAPFQRLKDRLPNASAVPDRE